MEYGQAWASSAWHEGEKSSSKQWHEREKSWLVIAFDICSPSRQRMCMWRVFTVIWSPVPQQLASFPGLKTGQGYSAVVLDHSQALPSSPSLFCARLLGGAWERGYISLVRLPQQLHKQHPCFLFCPGLTQPVFFSLCCFNGAAHCHVRFCVSLSGFSVVCGVLRRSLREHDCAISTTLKLHFVNFSINFPLDLL